MAKIKDYVYKIQKDKQEPLRAIPSVVEQVITEQLAGFVQGLPATPEEERFANALQANPNVGNFAFQQTYNTPIGNAKVSFMVEARGSLVPIQLNGPDFSLQQSRDQSLQEDQLLNDFFGSYGVNPIVRVPDFQGSTGGIMDNQESVNSIVEALF